MEFNGKETRKEKRAGKTERSRKNEGGTREKGEEMRGREEGGAKGRKDILLKSRRAVSSLSRPECVFNHIPYSFSLSQFDPPLMLRTSE